MYATDDCSEFCNPGDKIESDNFRWYNKNETSHLNIKNRKYIKINSDYRVVTLSSQRKGSPITVEDIFFATRAFCLDNDRYIVDPDEGGYFVLNSCERSNKSYLTLQPGMSTSYL